MIKLLFNYVFPLVLPTAAYLAWVWYYRKRAEALGGRPPEVTRGGLFWCLVLGLGLMIVSLLTLAAVTGVGPGEGGYQSPRLEDGRIIPPKFN
jgi:hypothetical protein|tara:strand:+ start:19484 stop:19762 length:279 start_codon:yes stop_codon:yes gene_type:complete